MRFVMLTCGALLVAACVPVVESPAPLRGNSVEVPHMAPAKPGSERLAPGYPAEPARLTRVMLSGVAFEGVAFDSRNQRLMVVEQQGLPGARFADAKEAARSVGGVAAVNGGFFTPDGGPLGLVIADGKRYGSWNATSSLGSGVWHADGAGQSGINRRESLGKTRAAGMQQLLQAGPMLVESGRVVPGLETTKSRARTVILWDGGHRWWIGRCASCTLARCAEILATASPAGWPISHALNLDGGRSSELWVSGQVDGGPVFSRPPWNKPVRNFLVLMPAR